MISVVIPIYNEEETIDELHRRVTAVLEGLDESWQVVYVNDGSRDSSRAMLSRSGQAAISEGSTSFMPRIACSDALIERP